MCIYIYIYVQSVYVYVCVYLCIASTDMCIIYKKLTTVQSHKKGLIYNRSRVHPLQAIGLSLRSKHPLWGQGGLLLYLEVHG